MFKNSLAQKLEFFFKFVCLFLFFNLYQDPLYSHDHLGFGMGNECRDASKF